METRAQPDDLPAPDGAATRDDRVAPPPVTFYPARVAAPAPPMALTPSQALWLASRRRAPAAAAIRYRPPAPGAPAAGGPEAVLATPSASATSRAQGDADAPPLPRASGLGAWITRLLHRRRYRPRH